MPDFDFVKNAVVEDVNTIPEQFRGLYEEATDGDNAGKYVINTASRGIVDAYIGTSKALVSARADKKIASDESATRRQALAAFRTLVNDLGVEADEEADLAEVIGAHIADLTSKVKGGDKIKIDLDKIKLDYEKKQAEALAGKDSEISDLRADLHQTKVSDVAAREISAAKGSIDLLQPIVERQCKVVKEDGRYQVRVVDAQGDFRSDGQGGWMGVAELVAELKASEKFARAFESEEQRGGGAPPGGMKRNMPAKSVELTSTQKIAAGLTKGQHQGGSGRRVN